jgi:hypothetical protein
VLEKRIGQMSGKKTSAPKKGKGFDMRPRYGVRAICDGVIGDVGKLSENLGLRIAVAKQHRSRYGLETWVWNLRSGETVFRAKPKGRAAGGAK